MKKDKMKKKMMGYNAGGKMPMNPETGLPMFVGDGKGKMMMGGKVMGYKEGDMVKAAKEKVKKGKTKRLQFGGGPKGYKGFGSELPRLLGFDYDGAGISDEDMAKNSANLKKAKKQKQKKMAGGMMKKKMMGGGKVMGYKHGGKHVGKTSMPRGCGVATRQRPAKMVVMKGS